MDFGFWADATVKSFNGLAFWSLVLKDDSFVGSARIYPFLKITTVF